MCKISWLRLFHLFLLALLLLGCSPAEPAASGAHTLEGTAMSSFNLSTPAFKDSESIPTRYTCDGENKSPDFTWTTPPPGTRSLALVADDPDAPMGVFTHWVLYNLPPTLTSLPEGLPQVAQPRPIGASGTQGMNSFRHTGFDGPCPPRGSDHRYFFRLYALDLEPNLPAGLTADRLRSALQDHILAQAQIMGRYRR
jgi:Raf kinase inhibitor-like YbhB/YbcL family protein